MRNCLCFGLAVLIVILDQSLKYCVVQQVLYNEVVKVFACLNITLSYNAGAAFAFLNHPGGLQVYFFSAFSLLAIIFCIQWLRQTPSYAWCRAISLSWIMGGALGNVIDRLRLGYVIDFIDFHIRTWHFATFNMADVAVCVGAACFVISYYLPLCNRSPKL